MSRVAEVHVDHQRVLAQIARLNAGNRPPTPRAKVLMDEAGMRVTEGFSGIVVSVEPCGDYPDGQTIELTDEQAEALLRCQWRPWWR